MQRALVISAVCLLLTLFTGGSVLADEEFGPGVFDDECPTVLDPVHCCDRPADEASRVATARQILRVNARVVDGVPDPDHYHIAINSWAVNGSGEDGVGEDGAVYRETTLSNFGRQEMWDYLDLIFAWSSDMELVTYDELWETHPDDSMTYMVVNKWFGNTEAGYYEQPGISIVKFRPGEGCAAYQRDYFSEGDTWSGMEFLQSMVREMREDHIATLGLTDRCFDNDGDGYSRYSNTTGCANAGWDCNDYDDTIHPGAAEICNGLGVDEDCDGLIDSDDPDCPPAG